VTFTGPTVDGVQRGVRYISLGFIQNLTTTTRYVQSTGANERRRSTLEGVRYLDTIRRSTPPWYSTNARQIITGDTPPTANNLKFVIQDRPAGQPVGTSYSIDGHAIDSFALRLDFDIYFAVTTRDPSSLDGLVYTQRAVAAWHSAAYGGITGNTFNIDAGRSENNGSQKLAETKDGTRVTTVKGQTFNEMMDAGALTESFVTEPIP
jgi:hypothetical protein